MNYAALLGLLVGLSVIVPYIGATLVTVPVVMVGFFQWGLSTEFYYLFGVYVFIQILDGNVLVPFLFSTSNVGMLVYKSVSNVQPSLCNKISF